MSKNELPETGDWESVAAAIHRQMKRLDMSLARLSRQSGVSETTIRYIGRSEKRQRSTLVALSAALGCRHDYLVDVLHGEAAAEPEPPPSDTELLHSLMSKVDELEKIVLSTGSKAACSWSAETRMRRPPERGQGSANSVESPRSVL